LKENINYYCIEDTNNKICKKYFNKNDTFYDDIYGNNYEDINTESSYSSEINSDSDSDSKSISFRNKKTKKVNLLNKIIEMSSKIVNIIEKL
jgi:hypothetical protein